MHVPFMDLREQHTPRFEAQAIEALRRVLSSSAFIGGEDVSAFESEWAEACGRSCCVGTASGTDALRIMLQALDVGPGDEVIVPAMTFVATYEAIWQTGAVPAPADIDLRDYGIDAADVPKVLSRNIRQVMLPVALYGMPSDIDALRQFGLEIVEDACQAHGADLDPGTCATAFSFYPSKNLGALGDAGAIVTDDPQLAEKARALRHHGEHNGEHLSIGTTARLDTLQAAFLRAKLAMFDQEDWNGQRLRAAGEWAELLDGVGDIVLPPIVAGGRLSACHLYVIRTGRRDDLRAWLAAKGVETKVHYPVPPLLTPAFRPLGYAAGAFPNAELLAATGLSLPLYPGITELEQQYVAEQIRGFYRG